MRPSSQWQVQEWLLCKLAVTLWYAMAVYKLTFRLACSSHRQIYTWCYRKANTLIPHHAMPQILNTWSHLKNLFLFSWATTPTVPTASHAQWVTIARHPSAPLRHAQAGLIRTKRGSQGVFYAQLASPAWVWPTHQLTVMQDTTVVMGNNCARYVDCLVLVFFKLFKMMLVWFH